MNRVDRCTWLTFVRSALIDTVRAAISRCDLDGAPGGGARLLLLGKGVAISWPLGRNEKPSLRPLVIFRIQGGNLKEPVRAPSLARFFFQKKRRSDVLYYASLSPLFSK